MNILTLCPEQLEHAYSCLVFGAHCLRIHLFLVTQSLLSLLLFSC